MTYARRVDSTQSEIVKALRKVGCYVKVIGQPLDLLCYARGRMFLADAKSQYGKMTKAQAEFVASFPGEVYFWKTPEQAVRDATKC